jgi:hypothetical protein
MTIRLHQPVLPAFFTLLLAALPAHGESWRAEPVEVPGGRISALRDAANGAHVQAGGRWMAVTPCTGTGLCFAPSKKPFRKPAPAGGLADGFLATRAAGAGIVQAWYETPTTVYGHGILGDATEAATLAVRTRAGKRLTIGAGAGHVFEDLTPRLADLDGDGRSEVITVRTDVRRGAAVAVYGLVKNRLVMIASTKPIGRPNRWRNPALTVADPIGRGRLIAEVVTPHIGGTLNLWALEGSAGSGFRLARHASARGFSNHVIGSRELGLMADAGSLIAVPSGDRSSLRILQLGRSGLSDRTTVKLPGRIGHAVAVLEGKSGPVFLAGLEDGRLFAVHRPGS